MKKILLIVLIGSTVLLAGCNRSGFVYVEGKINIVATTTMIGDLVQELGGDMVSVTTMMGVGVDPHLYQPKPSDTNALLKADLVIINGLHLEGQLGEVLTQLDENRVLVIGDHIPTELLITADDGSIDPHIWFDVSIWIYAAEIVTDKLIELDTENKSAFENRLNAYRMELEALHQYILERSAELTPEQRVLVTAHDAFGYFGLAYGFDVHAIQGISTEGEASVSDIQALAELVKELNVKAIFIESTVPEFTVNSVIQTAQALGHTIVIGGELYSDSLGDLEHGTETYIKTMRSNIDKIINALK